jgi:alpha-tubulin suppressor-like RCC1 family protein
LTGSGLLGNGSKQTSSSAPVAVKGLSGVKSLASDQAGYCALLISGRAKCWGDNHYSELGDGKPGDLGGNPSASQLFSNVPAPVKGLTGAESLVSDGYGYCAQLRSGGVECWGSGSFGELGDGLIRSAADKYGSDVPVAVKGLTGVKSLASTDYGFCALLKTGTAKCWGYNNFDELGDGKTFSSQAYSDVPVAVLGLSGATSLLGGEIGYTYCAVLGNGASVKCWGDNAMGLLGDGGSENFSDTPVTAKGLTGVKSLTIGTGDENICATLTNGGAECWGENFSGGLGAGLTTQVYSYVPVKVVGLGP